MMHEQCVELIRHRKHYMKVRNRKKVAFAVFYPGFPLGVLALWTMTVTTGVIADANMPALIAPINMAAHGGAAATLQRTQGPSHVCVGPMLFYELCSVIINYLGQFICRSQALSYNLSNGLNRLVRFGLAT